MDVEILEDIGFTNAEIKVYLALLELGTTTAGPIIERSGLQSSVVHMTLIKLVAKGFVSVIKEGKRQHYSAGNPEHIIQYIDEKKKRFQQLLPELLTKRDNIHKTEVVSFRGVRGIKELLYELLEAPGKEHHTIGSSKKSLIMGDAWWVNYHRKRAANNIKAKLLFNESLRYWTAEIKYPNAEVRYTQTGFEPLTETIIRGDTVGIIIWSELPLGIIIRQKEAADSYEAFFQTLWNTTKPNTKSLKGEQVKDK